MKYLNDPRYGLLLGVIFFCIAIIDTIFLGANNFTDMYWWSKTALIGFCLVLGTMAIRFFFLPLFRQLFKK